jgi:glycerophosphoryl diester phosphodiesterase
MTILRIGHRGAAGYEPENTLASFRRAIEIGVDFIETDLQKTADGHIVIMHDKRVDRTTSGAGYVSEMTLAELRRLDAGQGESVPTLEELLALASGKTGLMLEIITPGLAAEVVRRVKASGFQGAAIYASFHHGEALAASSESPECLRLALLEGVPISPTAFALEARATHVGLAMDSVTPEFIDSLRAAGLNIFVYTANDPRDIAVCKAMQVHGIISDYPDRV